MCDPKRSKHKENKKICVSINKKRTKNEIICIFFLFISSSPVRWCAHYVQMRCSKTSLPLLPAGHVLACQTFNGACFAARRALFHTNLRPATCNLNSPTTLPHTHEQCQTITKCSLCSVLFNER